MTGDSEPLGSFERRLVYAAAGVAAAGILALIGIAVVAGSGQAAAEAATVFPAIATLVASIAIIRLTARYVQVTEKMADATEVLALLQHEEAERRRSKFKVRDVWTELRFYHHAFMPSLVPFQFSVRNAGGQDAAIEEVFVEFPRQDGGRYRQRIVDLKRIPRFNEDEADWIVRSGDRVRFSARVAAPANFNGHAPLVVVSVTGEESRATIRFLDGGEAEEERDREAEDALGL